MSGKTDTSKMLTRKNCRGCHVNPVFEQEFCSERCRKLSEFPPNQTTEANQGIVRTLCSIVLMIIIFAIISFFGFFKQ